MNLVTDPSLGVSIQDLTGAMASAGVTTDGWDIVCSYRIDQLNQMLKDVYNSSNSGIIKEFKDTFTGKDDMGNTYTLDFDIFFGEPSIKFIAGQKNQCILTMLITSGTSVYNCNGFKKTEALPLNTFSLSACYPINAVSGGESVPGGQIFEFTSGNESASIILNFKDGADGANFNVSPIPDENIYPIMAHHLAPELDIYFKSKVDYIEYKLTDLTNQIPSAPGLNNGIVIEPLSFVFATSGGDTDGVLSLYIQTKNSGNSPGLPNPVFKVNEILSPIPEDHQASLIISRDCFQKVFLVPTLNNLKSNNTNVFINVTSVNDTIKPNCDVEANYNFASKIDSSDIHTDAISTIEFDSVTIDFSTKFIIFDFSMDKLNVTLPEMSYSQYWSYTRDFPTQSVGVDGTAKVKISIQNTYNLTNTTEAFGVFTVTDSDLVINSFTVTPILSFDAGTNGSCIGGGGGIYSQVNKKLHNEIEQLPAITFPNSGLQYFKETNLLFPGKQVLSFDASAGVYIPNDLILFANFKEKEKNNAKNYKPTKI
jgi:hypothetical protein